MQLVKGIKKDLALLSKGIARPRQAALRLLVFALLCTMISCGTKKAPYSLDDFKELNALHEKMTEPKPGDWLHSKHEEGQSFRSYTSSKPVRPDAYNRRIHLLLLGDFDNIDLEVIQQLRAYTEAFTGMKVNVTGPVSDSIIPANARRQHEGHEQLLSTHIMHQVLALDFPDSTLLNIALTSKDLYPKASWNFVFGQASLKHHVGVSSIYRHKQQYLKNSDFALYLDRVVKTTTHETMHMLSLPHCREYKCLVNGSMSQKEADGKPTWLCGECLAKLIWCTNTDVVQRYDKLIEYAKNNGYREKEIFYQRSKEMMTR